MLNTNTFHVMAKPIGSICNLHCSYCYYLKKERLYHNSDFKMNEAILERFTKDYIETHQGDEVVFSWQGGEPTLLGLRYFELAVKLQRKYRCDGKRIYNTFQTNGTLLDDAWCRFLKEHDFLVGLSLDGPRELHDVYRMDKGSTPTFGRVMRGLERLKAHNVAFNLLVTIHAGNVAYPLEVYRFSRDIAGCAFLQFIPIVERNNTTGFQEGGEVSERSITGQQYGTFLNTIFDEWVRRDVGRVFVQIFDVSLGIWLGDPASLCIFTETCGNALALEHNGDIFSCDHYVEPRYYLGNIMNTSLATLATIPKQIIFGNAKQKNLPKQCRECPVLFACQGGCPKDRILTTRDLEYGLNYLCDGYKAFFIHIDPVMKRMVELLKSQRPPSEIMKYL